MVGHLRRREFFKLATGMAAFSASPILFAVPAKAIAIETGLAIASVVAGMIAAHNRRDTNAVILGAVREELRVISGQLATLQQGVSYALLALEGLPKQVEEILRRQSVRELHRNLSAEVKRYAHNRALLAAYEGDELAWLKGSNRFLQLNDILFKMQTARSRLEESDFPIDPTATMVMCSSFLSELSVMNHLRCDAETGIGTIKMFEDYLRRVCDPSQPESAAHYLASRQAAFADVEMRIAKDPLGMQLESAKDIHGAVVGLEDYRGSFNKKVGYQEHRIPMIADGGSTWTPIYETIPARQGDFYRLVRTIAYSDQALEDIPEVRVRLDATSAALGLPKLDRGATRIVLRRIKLGADILQRRAVNAPWSAPPTGAYHSERRDLAGVPDPGIAEAIRAVPQWKEAEARIATLDKLIDERNRESSKIVFAEQSLEAAKATLKTLAKLKRSFS